MRHNRHPLIPGRLLATWRALMISVLSFGMISCAEVHPQPGTEPIQDPITRAESVAKKMNGLFYFYGKILDQDNQPVANADVTLEIGRIQANLGTISGKADDINSRSDLNGSFSFVDVRGYLFIIKAMAPGYVIDTFRLSFNYQDSDTVKCDQLSAKDKPFVIRAWKLGPPSTNRQIVLDRKGAGENFRANDNKELFVKIRRELRGDGEPKPLLQDPSLVRVEANEDWDVALSLVSNADAGEAPFAERNMKKVPTGVAIRVRTKSGEVCQADTTFPYSITKENLSTSTVLKWSGAVKGDNQAYFRIKYRNDPIGYWAFLTIVYENKSQREESDCRLKFDSSVRLAEPRVGVINVSGSGNLECFPNYLRELEEDAVNMRKQEERLKTEKYQEDHLDELRRNNPGLAEEVEERMRKAGKTVPPAGVRNP